MGIARLFMLFLTCFAAAGLPGLARADSLETSVYSGAAVGVSAAAPVVSGAAIVGSAALGASAGVASSVEALDRVSVNGQGNTVRTTPAHRLDAPRQPPRPHPLPLGRLN